MKKNSYAFLFVAVFLTAVTVHAANLAGNSTDGYFINMPSSGSESLTLSSSVTSFKVYDDGGRDGLYSANASGYLEITAPTNKKLVLTGVLKSQYYGGTGSAPDFLTIYDGASTDPTLVSGAFSPNAHGEPYYITTASSDNKVTLYFKSDNSYQFDGLDLLVQVVSSATESHSISLIQKTGGTITASSQTAQIGATVSLSASTNTGYMLNGITVQGTDKYPVRVVNDLWYNTNPSFVMRGTNVTVTPTYTTAKTKEAGLGIVLPRIGDVEATIPAGVVSFKVEDDGGYKEGNGASSESAYGNLIMTAPTGKILQVTGNVVQNSGLAAQTRIYDGGKTGTPLVDQSGSLDVGVLASSSNKLTLGYRGGNVDIDLKVAVIDPTITHEIETNNVVGGSASCLLTEAKYHDNVSVSLTYGNAYLPIGLVVTSSDGTPVKVNLPSSFVTSAEFEMPYGDVFVEPQFTTDWTADGGLYANVPSLGKTIIDIPAGVTSFHVYDDGGKDGLMSASVDGILVLQAPSGKLLQLKGVANAWGSSVSIYDGDESGDELKTINAYGEYDIGSVFSFGRTMAIKLKNTTGSTAKGLDFVATVVDPSVKHDVTIPTMEGGSVSSNVGLAGAAYGTLVELTVTPTSEDGYFLGGIKVTEEDGTPVTVTKDASGNVYSFSMPYSRVTVEPFFANPKIATFDDVGGLNNGTYFYLDCSGNVCTISQGVDDNATHTYKSKYWYVESGPHDEEVCEWDEWHQQPISCDYGVLYEYQNTYSSNTTLKLGTSLDFGGRDATDKCLMQFQPISGPTVIDGNNETVKGLCQTSVNYSGFVYAGYQSLSISNVTFVNAYIAGEGFIGAGVVAAEASSGVTISNVKVENSIVRAASQVGGLVGYAAGTISIQNSSFEGDVSGKGPNAKLGGLVGYASTQDMTIEKSFVKSDVTNLSSQLTPGNVTNNYVGGLVGMVEASSNGYPVALTIKNTYSIGEVSSAALTVNNSTDKLGYIVGNIASGLTDASRIVNNYHVGDDKAELGVGAIANFISYDADSWKQGATGYCYGNVRNSTTSISATGAMGYHRNDTYDGILSVPDNTYVDFFAGSVGMYDPIERTANGVASVADMESGLLAALMNYNQEVEGESDLWVSDGGLPVFAGTSDKPNHLVVVQTKLITDAQQIIKAGLEPVQEYYYKYNGPIEYSILAAGLTAFTDASGKLDAVGMSAAAAVKAAVADNAGVEEEAVAFVDASGKAISLTEEFSSSQVISALVNYTVSFDLSSLKDSTVVLGGDWVATKTGVNVESQEKFPRVYVLKKEANEYSLAEWGSAMAQVSVNADRSDHLTSQMLSEINPTSSKITVLPLVSTTTSAVAKLRVVAYDEDGNALTDSSDYCGSVVLSQVVGADVNDLKQTSSLCDISAGATNGTYNHCLYLPNANDTLTFKVSLVPKDGYAMELTGFSFDWMEPTGAIGVAPPGFGYDASTSELVIAPAFMAYNDMTLRVKYTVTGPFYVTYNMNINAGDEDKLFFPMDASPAGKFEFDETVVSADLWEPVRSDKCFDGWSVVQPVNPAVPASEPPKITTLYAKYAASALSMNPDAPTELQANWSDCAGGQPAAGIMIANGDTTAKVMLKQVFDGAEYEHLLGGAAIELPANTSGYKFFIDSANSVVDLGYEAVGVSVMYSVNGVKHEMAIEGDSIVVGKSNVSDFLVTMETQVALDGKQFWINGNADTVFYGTSITMLEVEAQKDEPITTDVYRVGYKLKGWNFENGSASMAHLKFDTDFEKDYIKFAKAYGRLPDTLYAVWEADANAGVKRVVNKSGDVSSFKLMQDLSGQTFEYVVSDSLLLPAEGHFEFIVEMLYDPNEIEVDDRRAIVVLNEAGELDEILENYVLYAVEKSIGLKANVLKDKRVQFVLNDNSEDQVFFGSDWIDTLASENPDSDLELPKIAYNSAKCLAGWTIDSTSNKLLKVLDKDLLNDLRAKGNAQGRSISELLYAKWTTNLDSCAGDFMKLAIEQENGSVWFVEDDKDKTIKRDFTEDGTMFVPLELDGRKFRVQASGVDTSVYVLDSLVVLRNSKVDTVLFVGDLMPEVLDSTMSLKAYFGWKNKTKLEIVRSRLASSGAMFKLSFKASDFEVRRHVSAWVGVYDAVKDSIVRSFDLGDSVVMGYDTAFVFPMRKPGNYRMVVTLEDQTGLKDTLSRDFSVDPEIASVAADSWQMLSLSAVDMSSIKKDGDQIFYWWDDQGLGEFWQYKQLDLNDPVDATVGVWYNSLEGRPLVLRDEIDDEGDDFAWKLDCAKTGWNLVANPHGWAVSLFASYPEIAKDVDENSEVIFWKWNTETGNYDPMPRDIGPYEAVWAQVTKKTEWKVSAEPVFEPETINALEKSRALVKATTKDRWTLQAVLSDEKGKRDSWNILGAGLNPIAADEPPEGMGDHVNLSIVEGKRALAKSIKEANDELEWTVALSASSNRIGYLSFAGIDGVKSFGYRVFVTLDGNTTEMQEGVPLKVYLKTTAKTATVRVAPAARVVAQNSLKGLRMARLGGKLKVSFDAMGLAGTNARVDLLDMKGNVISTVTAKTLEGSNALVLDAPQTGLYMLRVRAGSKQQATKVVVR